eukprot:4597184-Prymnesium_polylepis.1
MSGCRIPRSTSASGTLILLERQETMEAQAPTDASYEMEEVEETLVEFDSSQDEEDEIFDAAFFQRVGVLGEITDDDDDSEYTLDYDGLKEDGHDDDATWEEVGSHGHD